MSTDDVFVERADEVWLDQLSIKQCLGNQPPSKTEVHQVVSIGNAAVAVDLVEGLVVARATKQAEVEVEEGFGDFFVPFPRHAASVKRRLAFEAEPEDLPKLVARQFHKRIGGVLQQLGPTHLDLLPAILPSNLHKHSARRTNVTVQTRQPGNARRRKL